jgi:cytochrome P450
MAQALPQRGPPGVWPLGNLREIRRDMLAFFTRCRNEFGDVARMQFGPRTVYLLSSPELIEDVLVTRNRSFRKHYAFRFLRPLLGDGLLISEGETWLRQRRLMQPAFGRESLARYGGIMVADAEKMLQGWSDGQPRDIYHDMTQLTLRIAAKTLMDIDIGQQLEDVGRGQDVAMDDFRRRFQSPLPLPLWLPTPKNLRMRAALRRLDAVIHGIIRQRRDSNEFRGDLLSILMRAQDEDGSRMTDRQLRDETMTLLLAGHETTANALSWTWYLLAQHPHVEQKLLEELEAVLGERLPTADDWPRLVYTERVVKESMRLFPPAYTIGRAACEETTIGDYRVPRGTTVFMSQWVVHRDSRWYADPEKFEPDRWSQSLERERPKYSYFPFGGGPRVCIGNTFAMMEATLLVAAVARRYQIRLAEDRPVQPWPTITLRPRGGIPVIVRRRKIASLVEAHGN